MSLKIARPYETPPGGWRFHVKETDTLISAPTRSDRNDLVLKHYLSNSIPLPTSLEADMDAWLCNQIAPGYCEENEAVPTSGALKSLQTVINGTMTLMSYVFGAEELVSQEHADGRAKVCATCPKNRPIANCTPCNWPVLLSVIEKVIGKRATRHDVHLQNCEVCECHLRAKVHFPWKALWNNMTAQQKKELPGFCWLKTEHA